MMMKETAFALFDFDDTLSHGDSIVPFLLYALRKGWTNPFHVFRACAVFLLQVIDRSKTIRAKEVTLSFLKGKSEEEAAKLADGFWRDVLSKRLLPQGREEIQRLKTEGKTIVVISASADVYMRLLPDYLPVDAVLCTKCEVDVYGRYTGTIQANCKGEEKPVRLQAYLDACGLRMDRKSSLAYGDSAGDRFMLALVDHPYWIDAKPKVQQMLPQAQCLHWH